MVFPGLAGRGPRRLGWAPAFTFWWFQALGAGGLEPSEGPFDHLLVLHLHGLGSVALIVVMARWEQLPSTTAGHLEGNVWERVSGQAGGQTPNSKGGRRCREGEDCRRRSEECRKEASKVGTKGVLGAWQADPLPGPNIHTPACMPACMPANSLNPSEGAHLQDFVDGFAVHGLLVVGGLVESTTEGAQWHQLFNTHLEGQPPPSHFSSFHTH